MRRLLSGEREGSNQSCYTRRCVEVSVILTCLPVTARIILYSLSSYLLMITNKLNWLMAFQCKLFNLFMPLWQLVIIYICKLLSITC